MLPELAQPQAFGTEESFFNAGNDYVRFNTGLDNFQNIENNL